MNRIYIILCAFIAGLQAFAIPDPNFHIYLCLGQSNMEGQGIIEEIDRTDVPDRFKVMAAVDYASPSRTKYNWYTAVPPLVRQGTGLGLTDWFGRTMVANLPQEVKVGVVMVAIGGCQIEIFDKDFDTSTLSGDALWLNSFLEKNYQHPYRTLVDCAKRAQEQGVIKGILLHQGEANCKDPQWPEKVKKVYTDLLTDLGLNAEEVPLIAGETIYACQGGRYGPMNGMVANLPHVIPTAHIVSAANLPHVGDRAHFTSAGYRVLGCRYAKVMLNLLGIADPKIAYTEDETIYAPNPDPSDGDYEFDLTQFNPYINVEGTWDAATGKFVGGYQAFGGWDYGRSFDLSGFKYLVAELAEPQSNGAELRIYDTANLWINPFRRYFDRGSTIVVAQLDGLTKQVDADDASKGFVAVNTAEIHRVGIGCWGGAPIYIKRVYATNNPATSYISDAVSGPECSVYNLQGIRLPIKGSDIGNLPSGVYIVNGQKVHVK